ncbi:Rhodanese-like domain-containing protein [Fusarium redolens]|uniref:Rhodanese-like domain-containing protein n=1 Tax=Fusarium redolens TaxID=48865 RepID=A0A9P9G212_FUSRE|nr:Rhodanese-like domain-containing protein [Fusarium redolens]KAH7230645.1 Rhodanese-like domain-containing protein [Fusarium redolens]
MNLTKSLLKASARPRLYLVFQKVNRICSSTMTSTDAATPWHAAYPPPLNKTPAAMTRQEVLEVMKDSKNIAGKNYVLIDLRRTDHEGGTIRGSINLPAQSLYPTIKTLYSLFKSAGVQKIIWYCSSSRGRGSRAAGWFKDHLDEQGDSHMESVILFEGITGWAKAGGEFVEWMDEYDATVWDRK